MARELRATYRLQLHSEFTFADAIAIIDYLRDLGVSHIYTSPYLQAADGSTHGYDVVDPTRVNDELGGDTAHARFCEALRAAELGHIIDIVPNHMAIETHSNPWWWDVLENGAASLYATYFDVDWENTEERWPNKILLPVLGNHYGRVLEAGELQLALDQQRFVLNYYDNQFPLDPSSIAIILQEAALDCGSEELAFLAESHSRLPRPTVKVQAAVQRRHRDKAVLHDLRLRLCDESDRVAAAIKNALERFNQDVEKLDGIIDQQNYRLAFWKTASRDLGYRRFFDVTTLAGIRVENPQVFDDTHALPLKWVSKGWVQGLRIDHPDGLRNPAAYFQQLRQSCPKAILYGEKILEPGEHLPEDWPIQGTTGYDFLNACTRILIDPDANTPLTDFYRSFTGQDQAYASLALNCKMLILDDYLVSELNRLTNLFVDICEQHRCYRDYTRFELKQALRLTAVSFPVYRSYVEAAKSRVTDQDRYTICTAITGARELADDMDPELFEFLQQILLLEIPGEAEAELAMRFQQLTGPTMAKGIEDTLFYRYNRLLCLNEVGGAPETFSLPLEDWHKDLQQRQKKWPLAMLTTTTHDTKRSEDMRCRLIALTEHSEHWANKVDQWWHKYSAQSPDQLPDKNTAYLVFQTLVGAWPINEERLTHYLEKAVREAKCYTSWTQNNEDYECLVRQFTVSLLNDKTFCDELDTFVTTIKPASWANGLSQTLLKLTVPGIPDIYQGTELWDLSLVDPDNRRPVDYRCRQALLATAKTLSAAQVVEDYDSGLPKIWLLQKTLDVRQSHSDAFGANANYNPVYAQGSRALHLVAHQRTSPDGRQSVIVITTRWSVRLKGNWDNTHIELPPGNWYDPLNGKQWSGKILLNELLADIPVGLLTLLP